MSIPTPPTLVYHVVDVFTDRAFAGNPLAVVLGADELSTDQMEGLATEFNLSETAFPVRPDTDEGQLADYRLRIFTPGGEIPFAGHPSVGTAWLMRELGQVTGATVHQLCGEGLLPLDFDHDLVTLTGGTPHLSGSCDPTLGLAAADLAETDLVGPPVQIASTGLPYLILPVTRKALDWCEPKGHLLREHFTFGAESCGLYLVAWDDASGPIHARMFAGDIGKDEDPATGSAALALGVYLGGNQLLSAGVSQVTVLQGEVMGRPSRLEVTCDVRGGSVREVKVGGRAVHVAEGRVAIPR